MRKTLVGFGLAMLVAQSAMAAQGTQAPGGNAPGGNAPGGNAPGGNAPGGNAPGGNAPGGNAPGGNAPGGNAFGANSAWTNAPGGNAPGGNAPGGNAPGGNAPGGNAPGGNNNAYMGTWPADHHKNGPTSSHWFRADSSYFLGFDQSWAQIEDKEYNSVRVVNGRLEIGNQECSAASCTFVPRATGTEVAGALLRIQIRDTDDYYAWAPIRVSAAMVDSGVTTIEAARATSQLGNSDAHYNNRANDHLRYRLALHGFYSWGGSDYVLLERNLCGSNAGDNDTSVSNPYTSNYGVFYNGVLENGTGRYRTQGFSYACDGGTAAKAIRTFGYKPWKSYAPAYPQAAGSVQSGFPLWLNALNGMMANYCEDGRGLTLLGTFVDVSDFPAALNQSTVSDSTYGFGWESYWRTSQYATTPNERVNCTGDIVTKPTPTSPDPSPAVTWPAACATAGSPAGVHNNRFGMYGALGDLRTMHNARYRQTTQWARCSLPGILWQNENNQDTAFGDDFISSTAAHVEIRTATTCGRPLNQTSAYTKPSVCGTCETEVDAIDQYCTRTGKWDALCASYANPAASNKINSCVANANRNASVSFYGGE